MGRPKKKKIAFDVDSVAPAAEPINDEPAPQPEAFVARNVDAPESKAERLSLKLKDDGTVDWDSHRGETREKIIKAFANDAETLRMIGLSSPLMPDGQGITDENARMALSLLAKANGILIPMASKMFFRFQIEPQIAAKSFEFTEVQLNEMAPRAARIANKYSSAAMLKFQDEIALASMFALYLSEQIKTAIVTQAMLNMAKARKDATIQVPPEGVSSGVNGHSVEATI
jgi:hypothetical protein